MGARQKLNASYFTGSLLLAALGGWLAESWLAFLVSLIVLVGFNLFFNEIRLTKEASHNENRG